MTTKTLYPTVVTQTSESGTNYREFKNLNNITNNKATYAKTSQIASKSGTHIRPSTVRTTAYNSKIPTNATINSVTVEYAVDYEGNVSIGKPTVSLIGASGSKTGQALTKTLTQTSIKFTDNLSTTTVNSSTFGVSINFPANTKADVGYVKIKYVRIVVDYTVPNYTVTASKLDGTYTNDTFKVQCNITNQNKNNTSPDVTITLSSGVTLDRKDSGDGTITSSGSTVTWKPGLTKKKYTSTITLLLDITTNGTHNIKFTENVGGANTTLNITTSKKPYYPDEDTINNHTPVVDVGETTPTVTNYKGYPTTLKTTMTETEEQSYTAFWLTVTSDTSGVDVLGQFRGGEYPSWTYDDPEYNTLDDVDYTLTAGTPQTLTRGEFKTVDGYTTVWVGARTPLEAKITVKAYGNSNLVGEWEIHLTVRPKEENLTYPNLTVLKLTEEETARLGDGVVYTLQTYAKQITTETYNRDWYKNFRIGIMNNINPNVDPYEDENGNIIDPTFYDSLTPLEIFQYAEYWSQALTTVNTWEELSVEFVHDKRYPVYVLITGDYSEGDQANNNIKYTTPCIVESDVYNGWETTGTYPVPIHDVIVSGGESSLRVGSFTESTPVIAYQPPVQETITDQHVVKGISVGFDISHTDLLSLTVKLKSPTGEYGERSIILEPDEFNCTLGGSNDKWGFNASDLVDLEQFEAEITVNNVFQTETGYSDLIFGNMLITFYAQEVETQTVTCYINGEDLSAYGAFITDIDVPAGLKTTTKFLEVDGTDTNDAYRQNIREKTITIDFNLSECDINNTTEVLQDITKLLYNTRDTLNKPIPKTLELTNYPGLYWNYIMEEPISTKANITDYDCTAKLTIPHGTAYNKEETVTNTYGRVNSIAKVNPVITLIPMDTHIEIEEDYTDQKWSLNHTGLTSTMQLIIDCNNRTVTLNDNGTETDITSDVDFGSDWFLIGDEYSFIGTGCIIQTITYRERS